MLIDQVYAVSLCRSITDQKISVKYFTWPEMIKRFKKVRRTPETRKEYDRMSPQNRDKAKNGPGFVGGAVRDGRRLKKNIESRSMLTLDADNASDQFLEDSRLGLGDTAHVIYATHSDRPEKRKFRLIIPLDREVSSDEYTAIGRWIAEAIGMEYFDRTTFEPSRLMYLPSCSLDADPCLISTPGDPLVADDILGLYGDWRDTSAWPRHPAEKRPPTVHLSTVTATGSSPKKKEGLIGYFCQIYDIATGINLFLPDHYKPGTMPNRYTYLFGQSVNGLQVTPEENICYSHQDSDPAADGYAHNIFDLVRIHLFGELDAGIIVLNKYTKLPSFLAMMAWVADLPEIKIAKVKELERDFLSWDDEDLDGWESQLELNPKTEKPLTTSKNIRILLENGDFKGALAFDSFRNVEVLQKYVPGLRDAESGIWRGHDDALLRHYMAEKWGILGKGLIADAFTCVTQKNSFHPIRDYLDGLTWDGVERAESCLITYLGADDDHYTRQVTRKMLLAGVYRIYQPGTKFDQMLVLVGPGGCGKSVFLSKLGKDWFSDGLKNLGNPKESGEHLQQAWILEVAELSAMRRAAIEEVKSFISKTSDRYRVAYDRVVSDFPRKSIFFGTTNDKNFLLDPTGNRRFWPVSVKRVPANIWHSLTREVVDQIWAEVSTWYKAGEDLLITEEASQVAEQYQKDHMEADGREGLIEAWLEKPYKVVDGRTIFKGIVDSVSPIQILIECFGLEKGKIKNYECKQIASIMRNISGWEEVGRKVDPVYGRQITFSRLKSHAKTMPDDA
jgi:predicted P-loop ATPase